MHYDTCEGCPSDFDSQLAEHMEQYQEAYDRHIDAELRAQAEETRHRAAMNEEMKNANA